MNRLSLIAIVALVASPVLHAADPVAAPVKPTAAPAVAAPLKPASAPAAAAPVKAVSAPAAAAPVKAVPTAAVAAPQKTSAHSQQDKMRECNKQATGKKGDERKSFMKTCLSKKV